MLRVQGPRSVLVPSLVARAARAAGRSWQRRAGGGRPGATQDPPRGRYRYQGPARFARAWLRVRNDSRSAVAAPREAVLSASCNATLLFSRPLDPFCLVDRTSFLYELRIGRVIEDSKSVVQVLRALHAVT